MKRPTAPHLAFALLVTVAGCGKIARPDHPGQNSGGNAPVDAATAGEAGSGGGGGGGAAGGGGGGGQGCTKETKLAGTIFAPNGTLPLYNASVFVPSGPVQALKEGAVCDRCVDGAMNNAVTATLSDASGHFTLEGVPAGKDVPLVVQLGKWRRQLTVPLVTDCQTTLVDPQATRLPRTAAEGDLPRMAIATGALDPFECLLRKIGIDDGEFTIPSGKGRVHFYLGGQRPGTKMDGAPKINDATMGLFTSLDQAMKYDVVLLPCEGYKDLGYITDPIHDILLKYLNAGGRLFATHLSYFWLHYTNSPFDVIGKWNPQQDNPQEPYVGLLDASFPKGKDFSAWLHNVDPSTQGSFTLVDPRNDLDSVDPKYAQRWVYGKSDQKVVHTTFNTPLNPPKDDKGNPQYCGRVVYSDFHVSSKAATAGGTFPDACVGGELTTQEKALAFMLFDLSACVAIDAPIP